MPSPIDINGILIEACLVLQSYCAYITSYLPESQYDYPTSQPRPSPMHNDHALH